MNEILKKRLEIIRLQIEIGDSEEAQSTLEILATTPQSIPLPVEKLLDIAGNLDSGTNTTALALLKELSDSL